MYTFQRFKTWNQDIAKDNTGIYIHDSNMFELLKSAICLRVGLFTLLFEAIHKKTMAGHRLQSQQVKDMHRGSGLSKLHVQYHNAEVTSGLSETSIYLFIRHLVEAYLFCTVCAVFLNIFLPPKNTCFWTALQKAHHQGEELIFPTFKNTAHQLSVHGRRRQLP